MRCHYPTAMTYYAWKCRVFTVEFLQSNSSEGEAFRLLPLGVLLMACLGVLGAHLGWAGFG